MPVSIPHRYKQAKATTVVDNRPTWSTGPRCDTRGRWRGLVGLFTATRPHWCGGCRRGRRAWLRRPWAVAGPGRASRRRAERSSRRGRLAGGPPPTGTQSSPAPPVWRAPEGPEGKGGLRGAAPNEVRSPSLAGGRALRRPEHQRGHTAAPRSTTRRRVGRLPAPHPSTPVIQQAITPSPAPPRG